MGFYVCAARYYWGWCRPRETGLRYAL